MKLSNNGSRVKVSKDEVIEFMRQFPCSGLVARSYWFEFGANGDLVDTNIPECADGTGASEALSSDAKTFWKDSK